jgi:hypothetical protein
MGDIQFIRLLIEVIDCFIVINSSLFSFGGNTNSIFHQNYFGLIAVLPVKLNVRYFIPGAFG